MCVCVCVCVFVTVDVCVCGCVFVTVDVCMYMCNFFCWYLMVLVLEYAVVCLAYFFLCVALVHVRGREGGRGRGVMHMCVYMHQCMEFYF